MSLIGRLDQLASMGVSPWHRASALGKLVLALGVVGIVVASRSLMLIGALHVVAWSLVLTTALPWRIVAVAASYPLLVSSLFVIATWGGGVREQAILLLRPVTASLMVLWLVSTTPYPDLFAPISRVLPRPLGDGLFLTYRALFELLGRTERLGRALPCVVAPLVRRRGGSPPPAKDSVRSYSMDSNAASDCMRRCCCGVIRGACAAAVTGRKSAVPISQWPASPRS